MASRRFYQAGRPTARKPPSVLSPFAQLRCYLRWGDVSAISSEGVTPPSSLLRAHVPLPLGSLLLRHLASFEESWQVVRSPCCPRELPDVISENLSLDAGSRTPAVHRVLSPVSSTMSSAFPKQRMGRLPAFCPANYDFSQVRVSRMQIFLDVPASKFALPPDRSYRCEILLQGSRGFYVRAYRALLPPHAPDMLTVRIQVIDGTGTFTLSDSQPCRLLTSLHRHYPASAVLRTSPPPQGARPVPRGIRLVIASHTLGLPVLRTLSLCTCCRHYPGAAARRTRRSASPSRISLPRKGCRVGLRIVLFEACSAFTRVTACTLALSPLRDTLTEGFSHFVTSIAAPAASGWSVRRVGLAPTGKRRLSRRTPETDIAERDSPNR